MKKSSIMDFLKLRWITGRRLVIAVPFAWLACAFLVPFLIVARISFTEADAGGNPFGTLMTLVDGVITFKVKISNYLFILQDDLYDLPQLPMPPSPPAVPDHRLPLRLLQGAFAADHSSGAMMMAMLPF